MSLEEALDRNTAAMEKHNALLEKVLASGGKPAGAAAKTPAKPAAKAAAKPAAKAAAKKPAAKKFTIDDLAAAFGKYLKTGDADERAAAKANVVAMVEYYGVPKATAIPEENWAEAMGYLKQYEAGETPEFDGVEAEEEDDGEALV